MQRPVCVLARIDIGRGGGGGGGGGGVKHRSWLINDLSQFIVQFVFLYSGAPMEFR